MPGGESHTTTTFGRTEVITKVLSWIPSYYPLWARDDLQGSGGGLISPRSNSDAPEYPRIFCLFFCFKKHRLRGDI